VVVFFLLFFLILKVLFLSVFILR